jgi:glycoprotein-N-acetylgalactosamine 3-beta-galactosyltransferase
MLLECCQRYMLFMRLMEHELLRDAKDNHELMWLPTTAFQVTTPTHQTLRIPLHHPSEASSLPPDVTFLLKRQQYNPSAGKTHTSKQQQQQQQCQIPPGRGAEGMWGYQALTTIQVHSENNSADKQKQARILCVVLTDSTRHNGRLQAIVETYAPHCDGFVAASNVTDSFLGAVDLFSSTMEEWQRVRQVWKYIHDHYLDDFDFYHMGGDKMYVIPENMREMVASVATSNDKIPLYLGGAVVASRQHPEQRYCGGGAGVTLNKAALSTFVKDLWECTTASTTPTVPADQQLAHCFAQKNIQCGHTLDDQSALRYLEFGIDYQAQWSRKVSGPIKRKPLIEFHGINMQTGIRGISESSVSFHLVNGVDPLPLNSPVETAMRRVHAILRGTCQNKWQFPLGALDENGKPGYIHDTTHLRKHPLPFTYHPLGDDHGVCDLVFGQGREGELGLKGLRKIQISPLASVPGKKVLCIVYTHSRRHERIRAIAETYAPRCDGFLAASNLTDVSIGAVNLLHEGPELCK